MKTNTTDVPRSVRFGLTMSEHLMRDLRSKIAENAPHMQARGFQILTDALWQIESLEEDQNWIARQIFREHVDATQDHVLVAVQNNFEQMADLISELESNLGWTP